MPNGVSRRAVLPGQACRTLSPPRLNDVQFPYCGPPTHETRALERKEGASPGNAAELSVQATRAAGFGVAGLIGGSAATRPGLAERLNHEELPRLSGAPPLGGTAGGRRGTFSRYLPAGGTGIDHSAPPTVRVVRRSCRVAGSTPGQTHFLVLNPLLNPGTLRKQKEPGPKTWLFSDNAHARPLEQTMVPRTGFEPVPPP